MERVGQVTKNASALIVAKLVTSVLFFFLAILINRNLGPRLAGIYAYAFSLYTMFQVIPDFGIGNISIRDVSQDHSKVSRYFSSIVPLRLTLGFVAFALLFLTNAGSYLFQSSDPLASMRFWVVLVISFSLLVEQPFSNSLAENFIALERLTIVAFVYFLMGIIRVASSAYVILSPGSDTKKLVFLMLIYILTSIYSVMHFGIVYRRVLRRGEKPAAAPQDKALAEAVIHGTPGQGGLGRALVADYSFSDFSRPALAVSSVYSYDDMVEPEEMPLEWQGLHARMRGTSRPPVLRRRPARHAEPERPDMPVRDEMPLEWQGLHARMRGTSRPPVSSAGAAPGPSGMATQQEPPAGTGTPGLPPQEPAPSAPPTTPGAVDEDLPAAVRAAGLPVGDKPREGEWDGTPAVMKQEAGGAAEPEDSVEKRSWPVRAETAEKKPVKRAAPDETKMWKYLLKSSWPLAVVSLGIAIYAGLDVPILAWIKGNEAVGLYNAGAMFAKAFAFLTLAVNMALLPAVSMVGGKHPEKLGDVWERLLRYAFVLMVPLAVIVPLLARPVLIFQKGAKGALFIEAWPVVWLTMGAMCFTLMTAISFPFFVVIDRQKKITAVIAVSLFIKAGLNIALIPLLGYKGAAVTMLASEFIVFLTLYVLLSRELVHRLRPVKFALVPLLSLLVLYGAAYLGHRLLVGDRVIVKHAFMSSLGYASIIVAIVLILFAVMALATRMLSRTGLNELNDLLKVE